MTAATARASRCTCGRFDELFGVVKPQLGHAIPAVKERLTDSDAFRLKSLCVGFKKPGHHIQWCPEIDDMPAQTRHTVDVFRICARPKGFEFIRRQIIWPLGKLYQFENLVFRPHHGPGHKFLDVELKW